MSESILLKFHALGLQLYCEKDADKGAVLWILRNFYKKLFQGTPPLAAPAS